MACTANHSMFASAIATTQRNTISWARIQRRPSPISRRSDRPASRGRTVSRARIDSMNPADARNPSASNSIAAGAVSACTRTPPAGGPATWATAAGPKDEDRREREREDGDLASNDGDREAGPELEEIGVAAERAGLRCHRQMMAERWRGARRLDRRSVRRVQWALDDARRTDRRGLLRGLAPDERSPDRGARTTFRRGARLASGSGDVADLGARGASRRGEGV